MVSNMKSVLIFLFTILATSQLMAAKPSYKPEHLKELGDSAYAAQNYVLAVRHYNELLTIAPSADVHYNLGNAHFRLREMGHAALEYERALHIQPSHDDARFNLHLLHTKLPDRFAPPQKMFFVSLLQRIISEQSVTFWTGISLAAFLLGLLSTLFYIGAFRIWLQKVSFTLSVLSGVAFLLTSIFALIQQHAFAHNLRAVVISPEVPTYTSATTHSTAGPTLHEGTSVEIIDHAHGGWTEVQLPDASHYWLSTSSIERVIQP